jgi:hypothetical protein
MKNIFQAIGRKIDDNIMKAYYFGDYTSTTHHDTSVSLTLDTLKESIQESIDSKQEFTRGFWQDFADKYNPKHIFVVVHPHALEMVEQEGGLDADVRPSWVHVSENCVLGQSFYVCECSCLCHDPHLSMIRRVLSNGNWCCQCSKYEDVT